MDRSVWGERNNEKGEIVKLSNDEKEWARGKE